MRALGAFEAFETALGTSSGEAAGLHYDLEQGSSSDLAQVGACRSLAHDARTHARPSTRRRSTPHRALLEHTAQKY